MMKFLFLTKEFPPIPDPSGRIVFNLSEELKRKGHSVDIIARDFVDKIDKNENGDLYWIKKRKTKLPYHLQRFRLWNG